MSVNSQSGLQPGIASMVGEMVAEALMLFRQETALAGREFAQAWKNLLCRGCGRIAASKARADPPRRALRKLLKVRKWHSPWRF